MSSLPTAGSLSTAESDPTITLYPIGHIPILLTDDERNGAKLVAQAQVLMEIFYGALDQAQRARLNALYDTPRVGVEALAKIVQDIKAQVNRSLTVLAGCEVDVDDVRIHTARLQHPAVSEPLWTWLSRGTPVQLAQPRLTRDANDFVDKSWLTLGGSVFAKADGSLVTVDEIIGIGRALDIGQSIAIECDAWGARADIVAAIKRESMAEFEISLLNALKVGRISATQYQQLLASAGLSLPDGSNVGQPLPGQAPQKVNYMLRVEGHELPVFVLRTDSDQFIYAGVFHEGRLFVSDVANSLPTMQVFTDAFRSDLWNTRRERSGWSWSLLTPSAQQAVNARLPQPLPVSNTYPSHAYWAHGAGVYASKEAYDRGAADVRFIAPYPLTRTAVAQRLAGAYTALLVERVKAHFTPNEQSSLASVKRIELEALAFVLDVILTPVPSVVKFPGRALLFKALFIKQLAVDLPLNLVESKWSDVAQTLVDFFETVVEMGAVRTAGKLLKSRLAPLNRVLLPKRSPGESEPDVHPDEPAMRLRSMLPPVLQALDDSALALILRQAGTSKQALNAMARGKADMDMSLAAAASHAMSRALSAQTLQLLGTERYTALPESVEWPVVAWLAHSLDIRIKVEDTAGHSLRTFEPESGAFDASGMAKRERALIRHDRWRYGTAQENGNGEIADSLFFHVQEPASSRDGVDHRDRAAQRLREDTAAQFKRPENQYRLQRAIHHDDRPRASVPEGEGTLLGVTVHGQRTVLDGRLQGADARDISAHCERCVPHANSAANLSKARYQADLAALAGGAGRSGLQSLTQGAESLYLSGMMQLLTEKGLGHSVALRIQVAGHSVSVWGDEQATQVLVLERSGRNDGYTYQGVLAGNDTVLAAGDSPAPVSDVLLRLLDDDARKRLGIDIGDAVALNKAVLERVPANDVGAVGQGRLIGVSAQIDPDLDVCIQPISLREEPFPNGLVRQDGKQWLPWEHGAVAVRQEGLAWRAQRPGGGSGPLLLRRYGEWRRLQERLDVVDQRVGSPVKGSALLQRLAAMHTRDPLARFYHDTVTGPESAGGGGTYIAFRGLTTTFYRVKPAEPGASALEVVRPAGTGGGVWLRQQASGLWQPARTLSAGMDNANEAALWRPWVRPGTQQVPRALGLIDSRHQAKFHVSSGSHKAANRFYPFVRPSNRAREFARRLAAAPAAVQQASDSTNIAAKVELFHRQWGLPIDITALRFFRMPGEITSEVKSISGALIADIVALQRAGQPLIRRIIEPMSGSGFYANFVRACGFRGELRVNDLNQLVILTQREIAQQPDRVKHHINSITQSLLEFWHARHAPAFDPQTLKIVFDDEDAAQALTTSEHVVRFREDMRHYFYTTVETQYSFIDGQIEVSPHSSFRADPVNGEAEARAYIAAAFYIMQSNTLRGRAPVEINAMGRLNLPMSIIARDRRTVLFLPHGLANLDGLNYLSYLHGNEQGQTVFSTGDGWHLLRVEHGRTNAGDLAIISGHFSDVYLNEVEFMTKVRDHVIPYIGNGGRAIITNAYSPYKERMFLALGFRVFIMENARNGFLLAVNDAVARDVGLPNA